MRPDPFFPATWVLEFVHLARQHNEMLPAKMGGHCRWLMCVP